MEGASEGGGLIHQVRGSGHCFGCGMLLSLKNYIIIIFSGSDIATIYKEHYVFFAKDSLVMIGSEAKEADISAWKNYCFIYSPKSFT